MCSSAAVVKHVELPKVSSDPSNPFCDEAFTEICNICLIIDLLNLFKGYGLSKRTSTVYTLDSIPNGCFANMGSSTYLEEISNVFFEAQGVSDETCEQLKKLFDRYLSHSQEKQNVLRRIILRLSQAKRRQSTEDKILDLGIALEMLLLDDQEQNELNYRFALRGSFLLGESKEERLELYQKLKS